MQKLINLKREILSGVWYGLIITAGLTALMFYADWNFSGSDCAPGEDCRAGFINYLINELSYNLLHWLKVIALFSIVIIGLSIIITIIKRNIVPKNIN